MDNSTNTLMPFGEGLEIVMAASATTDVIAVELTEALNRVLAVDVLTDTDMPPFDKSAMDGYACRKEDLSQELTVIEEIPAGSVPQKTIGRNQCARIMTGAMVPEGADFVLMKEFAEITGPGRIRCTKTTGQSNICYRAEDVAKNELLLRKGTLLNATHIAILASAGQVRPLVFCPPAVAVISTGNELVEPSVSPQLQQIRNSNGYQLLAQLKSMGIQAEYLGILKDDEGEVRSGLSVAIQKYDLVLISGGVSVGDYDFVPAVLDSLGAKILLHGMKVKPGKHLLFAKLGKKAIFGLPGNPVSSFVQFELLVKPFILKQMGHTGHSAGLKLPLAEDFIRQKADTLLFVPVTITADGAVLPLEYHGSAHLHAYANARGILEIPAGKNEIRKGEIVHVRPL